MWQDGWMKTSATSSELQSEKLIYGVPVKMTFPVHFHEWRLVIAWGCFQLFFSISAVSQIQLFGECFYNTMTRERRSAPDQSFSLLQYNSFVSMRSLTLLDILWLITSEANVCVLLLLWRAVYLNFSIIEKLRYSLRSKSQTKIFNDFSSIYQLPNSDYLQVLFRSIWRFFFDYDDFDYDYY